MHSGCHRTLHVCAMCVAGGADAHNGLSLVKGWCSLLCHFFEQLEEEGGTHCCGFTFEQLEEERGSKHSLNLRLQEAVRCILWTVVGDGVMLTACFYR